MAIVFDVQISVTVKTDDTNNSHSQGFRISLPHSTYERFYSIWPGILYQATECKKNLERELAECEKEIKK